MATEDFTTYTEVDPGADLTVTATKITAAGLARNVDAYVYADKGAGHFAGDFEHLLTTQIDSSPHDNSLVWFWGLGNAVDDCGQLFADGPFLGLRKHSGAGSSGLYHLTEKKAGQSSAFDISTGTSAGTPYYLEIQYDSGTGTFGTLFVRIYSDSGRTTLVDTSGVALKETPSFRYIYAISSWNTGGANGGVEANGFSENLDLQESGSAEVNVESWHQPPQMVHLPQWVAVPYH